MSSWIVSLEADRQRTCTHASVMTTTSTAPADKSAHAFRVRLSVGGAFWAPPLDYTCWHQNLGSLTRRSKPGDPASAPSRPAVLLTKDPNAGAEYGGP